MFEFVWHYLRFARLQQSAVKHLGTIFYIGYQET